MPPKKSKAAAAKAAEEPAQPPTFEKPSTEVFQELREIISQDPTKINENLPQVLQLVVTAEDPETPMFLRVRFLELVAQNMSHVRDESESKTFFKKLNQSLVNIISGEDNTPQLLSSALNCFGGFGPASIIQEQSFLAREASDILMQVALDTEAFDEPVRRTASEALNRLTQAALYPILEKLFYLISDSREVDDEEQLVKERRMAMNRIAKLVTSPALRTQWTEENQTNMVFTLVAAVMKSLNAEEFRQLMQSASRLPIVKEKHGAPLIEAFFKTCDLKSTRNLEAMTIVGQVLSPGVEFNFVEPLNAAGLLSKDVDLSSEHGVYHTRVLHLACQTATADNVEVLFRYVFAQLKKVVSANDIPASLSVLEALLLAAVVISAKNTKEPLKELDDDAFQASLSVLLEKVGEVEPLAVYAVKKLMLKKETTHHEAELVACIDNIKLIVAAFTTKHLPMVSVKESWGRFVRLPKLKKSTVRSAELPGSRKRTASRKEDNRSGPRGKRFRTESRRRRSRR